MDSLSFIFELDHLAFCGMFLLLGVLVSLIVGLIERIQEIRQEENKRKLELLEQETRVELARNGIVPPPFYCNDCGWIIARRNALSKNVDWPAEMAKLEEQKLAENGNDLAIPAGHAAAASQFVRKSEYETVADPTGDTPRPDPVGQMAGTPEAAAGVQDERPS